MSAQISIDCTRPLVIFEDEIKKVRHGGGLSS
jgi:hypothetical protein